MTNEEINRYIHVEIMGKCWHDWRSMGPNWGFRCGNDCGATSSFSRNPDYCSDDSPRRLLNAVVAKMVTGECEVDFLRAEHFISQIADFHTYSPLSVNGDIYSIDAYAMAVATAEQIATACVEAHKLTANPAA